jgi:hydrogenase expression/formation protein HypC
MRATLSALRERKSMCLAVPMQIKEVNGFIARCEAKGIERDVNLFMLQDETLVRGDFVMVHVGYAIQKVTEQDARSAWELYDQALAAERAHRNA